MSITTLSRRSAWLDRWNQPNAEQLIEALKPHQVRNFGKMIAAMKLMAGVRQELIWYGASWKWTLHFFVGDDSEDEANTLCYIVPNTESPVISVPYTLEFVSGLPSRRLSKFIRDGIRASKCAVSYHWATWTPGLDNEVTMLIDLLKRKHKQLCGEASKASN